MRKLLAGMLMGLSEVVSAQAMSVDKCNSDEVQFRFFQSS